MKLVSSTWHGTCAVLLPRPWEQHGGMAPSRAMHDATWVGSGSKALAALTATLDTRAAPDARPSFTMRMHMGDAEVLPAVELFGAAWPRVKLLQPNETGAGSWVLLVSSASPPAAASHEDSFDGGQPEAAQTPKGPLAVAFRFATTEGGEAFSSTFEAAKSAAAAYCTASAARQAAAAAAAARAAKEREALATAPQSAAVFASGDGDEAKGDTSLMAVPGAVEAGASQSQSNMSLKDQIKTMLLDPSFHGLLSQVERVWDELQADMEPEILHVLSTLR